MTDFYKASEGHFGAPRRRATRPVLDHRADPCSQPRVLTQGRGHKGRRDAVQCQMESEGCASLENERCSEWAEAREADLVLREVSVRYRLNLF